MVRAQRIVRSAKRLFQRLAGKQSLEFAYVSGASLIAKHDRQLTLVSIGAAAKIVN
jgi:hypothetical protein